MSNSISTLLLRNLSDIFGENDPVRRRAAIDEISCEDAVFYDPQGGIFRGRDEIDRIAGEIRATHLDFRYQPTAEPEPQATYHGKLELNYRHSGTFERWWTRGDSNSRPPRCERGITKAKTRRTIS
jgi:hypothetical protein